MITEIEGGPSENDLYVALSELFVDNKIDYPCIARVAIHFQLTHVEAVLLDRVAPVLWHSFFAFVFEWAGYDPDWLCREVEKVLAADRKLGFLKAQRLKIRRRFMAHMLKKEWNFLVQEYIWLECQKSR